MILSTIKGQKCRQIGQVQMHVAVNGTAVTPVASGPDAFFVSAVNDLGVGQYRVVVKEKSKIALFVSSIVAITPGVTAHVVATTTDSFTIQCLDTAGAPLDADIQIQWQHADQLSYYF